MDQFTHLTKKTRRYSKNIQTDENNNEYHMNYFGTFTTSKFSRSS
jgi:hypothetical protein